MRKNVKFNFKEQGKVEVISKNFTTSEHFHVDAEIFLVEEGKCFVTINGQKRELSSGDICFFESYNLHSFYVDNENLKARIIKIPYTLLEDYYVLKADRQLISNVITTKHLCNYLIELVDKLLSSSSTLVKNSTAKLIVAIIAEKLRFSAVKEKNETELIRKILGYLTIHFKEKLSLTEISKNLGYACEHVSRIFHKYLDMGIPDYINSLRYKYVESQLKQGRRGLQEIVFESGFGSLQTYYRYKAKLKKLDSSIQNIDK